MFYYINRIFGDTHVNCKLYDWYINVSFSHIVVYMKVSFLSEHNILR